jgi:DHA1 family bicyclomycin/chloramphenicol resistance-like MFS transporter
MTDVPPKRAIPITTLVALGIIGILGPFGTDVYLPALPEMARELDAPESLIRLTLSLYTLGMAVGQLIFGSLSDRFGRRTLMLGGGLLVAFAALSASRAESVEILLGSCLVLGLGSAAGLVTGRAVISDKTSGQEATKYFSLLQMVVSAGPIIGPLAGAAILGAADWRLIFTSLSAFAVIGVLGAIMFVPESLPVEKRLSARPQKVLKLMKEVLSNRQYLFFAATLWLSFGMLFAYISSSSFIFQQTLGLSSEFFATAFAVNGLGLVGASLISARIAHRYAAERIILCGLALQVVAILTLGLLALTNSAGVWSVALCLFLLVTSMGFILGPSTSLAIAPVRYASGTALALLGAIQFAGAGVSSSLAAMVSAQPLEGFLIVGTISTLLALAAASAGYRLLQSRN